MRKAVLGGIAAIAASWVMVPGTAALAGGGTTGADLQISGSASTGSPNPGALYSYTFQVKNTGPQSVTDAAFHDTLPVGATYRSVVVNGSTQYTCATGVAQSGATSVSCDLAVLPSAAQASVVLTADAPTVSGTFADTASISSTVVDPQLSNNSVTVNVQIKVATCNFGGQTPMYGLVMWKSVDPSTGVVSSFDFQVSGVDYIVYPNLFNTTQPLTQIINLNCKTVPSSFIQVGNFLNVTGTAGTTTLNGTVLPAIYANVIQVQTFLDMAA